MTIVKSTEIIKDKKTLITILKLPKLTSTEQKICKSTITKNLN